MAQNVECSCFNPLEPTVECCRNRWGRVVVVLRAHTAIPTAAADGPRDPSDRREREVAGPESSSVQACRLAENYSTLVSKRLLYSAKWEGAAECGSSSAAFGFRFPASRANVRGQAILIFPNQRVVNSWPSSQESISER
jgi:hypothetical protein